MKELLRDLPAVPLLHAPGKVIHSVEVLIIRHHAHAVVRHARLHRPHQPHMRVTKQVALKR